MYVDQSSIYEPSWMVLSISVVINKHDSNEYIYRYKCEAIVDGRKMRKGFNEDILINGIMPKYSSRFIHAIILRKIYLFLWRVHEIYGKWLENGKLSDKLEEVACVYPYDLFGHIKTFNNNTNWSKIST